AGGNIGGPSTGLPPGFPGGSTRCNATYRIVSAGTITNFCTTAQPAPPGTGLTNPTDSPFIAPGSEKLLIPSESNRYTSSIGTIDRDGLVTVVNPTASIKRNKYGDVVSTHAGDTNLSAIFSCTGSGTCTPKLGGTVYHITGNLTIDKDTVFQYGSGSTPGGAGTFVVDGELRVNANMQYFTPSTSVSVITDRRALPSAAFLVKQDVIVSQGVSVMVGVYYAEQQVRVDIGDTPLTVSGLMIAQNFDFRRRYRGLGSGSQEASELVIYDGRLQTNTPPGLSAITSSFPNVQELLP
ncbi:MAG: hypothetical protein HY976_03185, partial [Candidatus Kerfeldbacteria bacterium]|nr:hypothetical protein [Candidatus Kerfeldbacteria bacterium]